jgi:hypothetical protein
MVHHEWIDLRVGAGYGTTFHDADYNAAIRGYVERAPVGIWAEDGSNFYVDGFHLTASMKDLLDHQLGMLSWESWISHRLDTNGSTYGPRWTQVSSQTPADELLTELRASFFDTHPPVTGQNDEPSYDPKPVEDPAGNAVLGNRFVLAQSWWVASELVRRHPQLTVFEMHPGGGQYDVLCVSDPSEGEFMERTHVMLNRNGTLQVHFPSRTRTENVWISSWAHVAQSNDPHQYVKAIEHVAGLGHPPKAPASTERSLAYRVMSAASQMLVNDRHRWDWRSELLDSSDYCGPRNYLDGFNNAECALREARQGPDNGSAPEAHFWALRQDDARTVLVVSDLGFAYAPDHTWDLMENYRQTSRDIREVVTRILHNRV